MSSLFSSKAEAGIPTATAPPCPILLARSAGPLSCLRCKEGFYIALEGYACRSCKDVDSNCKICRVPDNSVRRRLAGAIAHVSVVPECTECIKGEADGASLSR